MPFVIKRVVRLQLRIVCVFTFAVNVNVAISLIYIFNIFYWVIIYFSGRDLTVFSFRYSSHFSLKASKTIHRAFVMHRPSVRPLRGTWSLMVETCSLSNAHIQATSSLIRSHAFMSATTHRGITFKSKFTCRTHVALL
jgi:hypothetical protein